MTRVIGVISGKGGVGKTTVVANLGAIFAQKYKKDVVIVDCNVSTSHLGLYLGMYYTPITLNQVLTGDAEIEEAMYEYHVSGLRVIPSSLSYSDLKGVDIARLKSTIKKLFGKVDIVLLDGAPGLGREALATVRASDEVLLINTPFVPSTMDIMKCHQVATEIGAKPLGVILNMVGKEKYEMTPKEVEELIELPVISNIPMDKNVLRSLALKMPVVLFSPGSRSSKEFSKLAAHLLEEKYEPDGWVYNLMKLFRPKSKK
ncbi:MAG: cell division ATPase MinD [Candidatus Aenigmarchaeota archaeon]|nr:cell division ATPase MinD [Candidatus Aenigmarchaeota archaeon]